MEALIQRGHTAPRCEVPQLGQVHSPALGEPQTEGISRGLPPNPLDLGVTGYLLTAGRDKADPRRSPGEGVTGPLLGAAPRAEVPGTYVLWHRGAWEARCLHEVPLRLALQSGGAGQRGVRLRRE